MVYLKASDGSIKQGNLYPGATTRVRPIDTLSGFMGWKAHLEKDNSDQGPTVLRCIRRTPLL